MRLITRLRYWWWRISRFRVIRARERAAVAQQQMFYEWARQPSPDFPPDMWEAAKAQVDEAMERERRHYAATGRYR